MKKQISLVTGAITIALLAGCSNNTTGSTASLLTITGSTSAALTSITVQSADGATLASDSTDTGGNYSLEVPDDSTLFPLTVSVVEDTDTLTTIVPDREKEGRHHDLKANVNGLTDLAYEKIHDSLDIHDVNRHEWELKVAESTDEWVKSETEQEHQKALEGAGCALTDTNALISDTLAALDSAVIAKQADLEQQLAAGTIDNEEFVKQIDEAFSDLREEAGQQSDHCADASGSSDSSAIEPDTLAIDTVTITDTVAAN